MDATASKIRAEVVKSTVSRAFRIYDTAESEKPNHASVFITKTARSKNMGEKKVRRCLFELFVAVQGYRSGIDEVKPAKSLSIKFMRDYKVF